MINSNSNKPKILVVDDVSENIHTIMNILRDNYAIIAATSGGKALEQANRKPLPDIILLDIKMPDMDGYEVLYKLKTNPVTADIPVIFVTALSETTDEAKGLRMGAADYITKPINPELLKLRVLTQLELQRYRYRFRIDNNSIHKKLAEQATILIVDDEPSNIHGLLTALSSDYRILVANHGIKVLDIVQQTPPDLILLDILMPDINGYEVCRLIKENKISQHIPILFLSILDESIDKVRGFSLGAADYIAKPFDIEEVKARIRTHLELSRYRHHLETVVTQALKELELKNKELLKLSQVVEQSPNSIMITDTQKCIEYVNDAFITHTGYSREEVIGKTPALLKSEKMPSAIYDDIRNSLATGQSWCGELINRRKDGGEVIESVIIAPIRQSDGVITHYIAIEQDVTEIRMAENMIHRLTNFDYLTGLPNKNLLIERLNHVLTNCNKHSNIGAIMMLNIDRFKMLVEAHGHYFADACLTAFSKRLVDLLDGDIMLARLSADTFAILLADLYADHKQASQQAISIIRHILDNLREPLQFEEHSILLSVSLGVALFPENTEDSVDHILRRADTALHQAKENDSSFAFFDASMTDYAEHRFRIERDLQIGISQGQLRLYLQPLVNAKQQPVGAEVLVRWQHPEQGLILPGIFIPIAEESELIIDIGIWVIKEACQLIKQAESEGLELNLSINISPKHFRQPEFVLWLTQQLFTSQVPPQRLTLELTENLLIKNMEDSIIKMRELHNLGLHFSIDDFGTGYSSLAYLKHLPIQELKIDRTFIRDIPDNNDDAILVETILAIAKNLHLKVVAEGVETQAQAEFLNARAEVIHQGYLFGRPEEASFWLNRWYKAECK